MKSNQINMISTIAQINNYIFFASSKNQCLIKMNMDSLQYEVVCFLNFNNVGVAIYCCEKNGYIYCIPTGGLEIFEYDFNKKTHKYYSKNEKNIENVYVTICENKIVFFQRNIPGSIYFFDLDTKEYTSKEWKSQYIGRILTCCMKNNIFSFNLYNSKDMFISKFPFEKIERINMEIDDQIYCVNMDDDGNILASSNSCNMLYKYGNEKKIIEVGNNQFEIFKRIFLVNNLVVAVSKDNIWMIDQVNQYNINIRNHQEKKGALFYSCIAYSDKLFLLPWDSEELVVISGNKVEYIEIILKMKEQMQAKKGIIYEEVLCELQEYIFYLLGEQK